MLIKPGLIENWRMKLRHNHRLTKIGWAAAVGISVGTVGAALSVHRSPPLQIDTWVPPPYVVPVKSASHEQAQVTAAQLEQLQTRNRRLEALVTVLRQRAAEHRQLR